MDILSRNDMRSLVQAHGAGSSYISLYMPTERPGAADFQQNPIRFRQLVNRAKDKLKAAGMRGPDIDSYLAPAERLIDDYYFWLYASDSLAVFVARDWFKYYRLPAKFPEMAIVADRFHLKPLLSITASDSFFYVLALSQHQVRLLHCTHFGCNEIELSGKLPRSLPEALRYDNKDREQQFHHHTGQGIPSLGSSGLIGHGPEVEDTKDNLRRFFQMVDRGLQREFLHSESAPLVVVCVDYLFPIYRKANTYKNLLDKNVDGSPDRMSALGLRKLALGRVEPYFKSRQEDAKRQFVALAGKGRATNDLEKIIADSYYGRVFTLFVADKAQKWGSYNPSDEKVETHSTAVDGDIDLLDLAAEQTLANRGEVYVVDADMVPGGGPIAAALRY